VDGGLSLVGKALELMPNVIRHVKGDRNTTVFLFARRRRLFFSNLLLAGRARFISEP
jgi:hypothetical protein